MPIVVNIDNGLSFDGIAFPNRTARQFDGVIRKDVNVPAAIAGTLTARTDTDTGELTLEGSHGVTTGNRIDVYWSGGSRRGMTVGTVDAQDVPIDGGTGDALPTASTAIAASVPVEEAFLIDGDSILLIAARADYRGMIVMADADETEIHAIATGSQTDDGKSYVWDSATGSANPTSGDDVAKAFFSHASTNSSVNMKLAVFNND